MTWATRRLDDLSAERSFRAVVSSRRWLVCDGGPVLIYKILLPAEWAEFEALGRFDGSPFDRSSGFIHCSTREQVADTAARVFGQEPTLVVVAVETEALGEAVRWEEAPDRGGMFPHVYGPLPKAAVAAVHEAAGALVVDRVLPLD